MKHAHFRAGEVIFREGDESREAYRILKGKVVITIQGDSGPVILSQLAAGDIFGEMGMVDERPRTAAARCLVDTECEVMTSTDFQEQILQNPERLLPYLATFFERLRTVTNQLQAELSRRSRESVVHALPAREHSQPIAPGFQAHSPDHHPERTRTHSMPSTPSVMPHSISEIRSISLSPLTPLCSSKFHEPFDHVAVEKFPFRIGRRNNEEGGVFSSNDFLIPDHAPFQVSRNHCSIEREGENYFVRDRGSTLGTIVNGTPVGVQHGTLTMDLKKGENILIVGSQKSPYKFLIEIL